MVSDKDIKAHEGLVRCGNCYSVFNSSWNLTDDPRSDFVDENINPAELKPTTSPGADFTFGFLGQDAATAPAGDNVSDRSEQIDEGVDELEHQQAVEGAANGAEHHDEDLEPFPEPDIGDDFHTITPEIKVKKAEENLLYFDSDKEEGEPEELVIEDDEKPVEIEDLTILQAASFSSEVPSLDRDDLLQAEDGGNEPDLNTLTEESMWPGAEVSFEDDEDDVDLGMPELGTPDAGDSASEARGADADDSSSMLSDFTIDEALLNDQSDDEPSLDSELLSEQSDSDHSEADLVLPDIFATEGDEREGSSLDILVASEASVDDAVADELSENITADDFLSDELEDNPAELLDAKDGIAQSSKGDDTLVVPGEYTETDERFSIDSLPDSTAEAFALDDEKENLGAESVFITSEDEDLDESYVPISLKEGEKDGSLHDLDDFPEPGELSDLNHEDTMEINAMLEAANISKQQIDSALLAADIAGEAGDEAGGDEMTSGEAMLSQDADVDLTEALSSTDEHSSESFFDGVDQPSNGEQSFVSRFKNMLPLGIGRKRTWKEPAIGNTEETQLIQSLHRSRSNYTPPLWVSKYSIIVISGLLTVILLGQVGYFYMDKLVRITPLRPVLEGACSIAGCTVPAIQNINDIEQLSSRMTAMTGDAGGFKVTSILVNRSIRSQAFPAIELTLTDRAGKTISRRVVTQNKYLNKENATQMKPNEAVDINIRFRTPSIRVDGFELRPVSQNWLEREK
jgi:hypothetical protein